MSFLSPSPSWNRARRWLGEQLLQLAQRIAPLDQPPSHSPSPSHSPAPTSSPASTSSPLSYELLKAQPPQGGSLALPQDPSAQRGLPLPQSHSLAAPASREPLSVEQAVLGRAMTLLKREAGDSLAALGAAHALITSARLSQVQHLREQVERGAVPMAALAALAADYQGWQNDQVRLFDALALVLRMSVPTGTALEQIDPHLHEQARAHLASLSAEYQRGLLNDQFRSSPSAPEG